MKRFWNEVEIVAQGAGWTIRLDQRPVKTPARAELVLPTRTLAEAICDEWRSVEGEIDPRMMPLTGLANAAIDRVAPAKDTFAQGLARYAEADLACYRDEGPRELAMRQAQSWDDLLGWARRRYDVDFAITTGLMHFSQPATTIEQLSHAVAALDAFHLAGLSPLVMIGGSLVAGLAVLDKARTPTQAWDAISINERWQLEQWGSDAEAELVLENRERDFLAAARFLDLLD